MRPEEKTPFLDKIVEDDRKVMIKKKPIKRALNFLGLHLSPEPKSRVNRKVYVTKSKNFIDFLKSMLK